MHQQFEKKDVCTNSWKWNWDWCLKGNLVLLWWCQSDRHAMFLSSWEKQRKTIIQRHVLTVSCLAQECLAVFWRILGSKGLGIIYEAERWWEILNKWCGEIHATYWKYYFKTYYCLRVHFTTKALIKSSIILARRGEQDLFLWQKHNCSLVKISLDPVAIERTSFQHGLAFWSLSSML